MNLKKAKLEPKIFADHNPLLIVWHGIGPKGRRWRLNDNSLLEEETLRKCKKDLEEYFKLNIQDDIPLRTVQEVSKFYMRGNLIAVASKNKKNERSVKN